MQAIVAYIPSICSRTDIHSNYFQVFCYVKNVYYLEQTYILSDYGMNYFYNKPYKTRGYLVDFF